jgi:hypothetical protein
VKSPARRETAPERLLNDYDSTLSRQPHMLSISPTYLFYYVPLVVAISLVYGGTRHENLRLILLHAAYTAYWITAFMGVIFLALLVMGWFV